MDVNNILNKAVEEIGNGTDNQGVAANSLNQDLSVVDSSGLGSIVIGGLIVTNILSEVIGVSKLKSNGVIHFCLTFLAGGLRAIKNDISKPENKTNSKRNELTYN